MEYITGIDWTNQRRRTCYVMTYWWRHVAGGQCQLPELMGILHSRQNQTPEAVSYHYQRACAAGCDNGSVIVDALLSNNAPANDVSISGSSAQVSLRW